MNDLPQPLTPPDCDLRTFEWMKLDVNRLLTSETWILGSADECKASVTLWCESWRQVPAASLPDDDRMLAHLSRAGTGWKKIREAVMKTWIKCSDGRIYHPVVAEKARDAWRERVSHRDRTEAARAAKMAKKNSSIVCQTDPQSSVTDSVKDSVTETVTETVTGSRGEERRGEENSKKERTDTTYPAQASPAPEKPPDLKTETWREGKRIVSNLTGQPEREAGAFVGRIAGLMKQDLAGMLAVFREAERLHPLDPSAWMMAAAKKRHQRAETGVSPRREKILRAAGLWDENQEKTINEPRGPLQ